VPVAPRPGLQDLRKPRGSSRAELPLIWEFQGQVVVFEHSFDQCSLARLPRSSDSYHWELRCGLLSSASFRCSAGVRRYIRRDPDGLSNVCERGKVRTKFSEGRESNPQALGRYVDLVL